MGWNLFKIVVNLWLKYLTLSFELMVAVNNSTIIAHVVVSSANLSKKYFGNFVQLVMDPTGKLKYHMEAELSKV
jgi:hypothetical protein